ncbi:MAG TPA: gamma-glutamyl-gamma-aminobutyrate hydrolase family protein [Solirubrobacteraceae bacterium]|nr:gamma-glutamyl-gamma-aminobutyrate hydrolase family protein [Solirubrobacteraceae bacterium]
MRSRPLIGISASLHDFGDYGGVGVHRPVLAAGGLPVTLPQLTSAIEPALESLDGLILAPGRDIDPRRYGQEPHPLLAATEPQRDAFELELVPRALERELPILGMCRGIQTLNVALGGTLAQDTSLISAEHPSDPGWVAWKMSEGASLRDEPMPPHPRHDIAVEPESILAQALGTTSIDVDSFHHQAIDGLAEGLAVVARSPDGLIEAVEMPGRPVLAVQWELQEEARVDPRFHAIFEWLIAEAAGRMRTSSAATAAARIGNAAGTSSAAAAAAAPTTSAGAASAAAAPTTSAA